MKKKVITYEEVGILKWRLTDYDFQQYSRFVKGYEQEFKEFEFKEFEFKEFDRNNYNLVDELDKLGEADFYDLYFDKNEYWIIERINLKDYSIEEQKYYCSAYYPENEFKDLTNWIIAECIFEQTSGLY